jgi:hypothetical protein
MLIILIKPNLRGFDGTSPFKWGSIGSTGIKRRENFVYLT